MNLHDIITNKILDEMYVTYKRDKKAGIIVHHNIVKSLEPLMPAINKQDGKENNLDFMAYVIEATFVEAQRRENYFR